MPPAEPYHWNFPGGGLALSGQTRIMGVVNVTPDSFSDGGRHDHPDRARDHALTLWAEGADILDIGGESSRPGASPVSAEEEIARVVPVIERIKHQQPDAVLSIDTTKADVARAALAAGAVIINDISAGNMDPEMLPLAAETGAGLVLMHMRGRPSDMQKEPRYADVTQEVIAFFQERLQAAQQAGIAPGAIVLDPGIGFGKTLDHNLTLIRDLPVMIEALPYPFLLGVSRKRWLGEITGREVDDRLAASLAGFSACVERGAKIMRVHDVLFSCDVARIIDRIHQNTSATTTAIK
ncbi:MAG: dihydropteroate synthase [Verrucomicrobia bacterium]|nr:dihydropteroate synthase [Verrucomicrobiota bacterium]MCH8510791.1 dihydropteroate synthase [Kiritimatiellia bacterium]